MSEAGENFELYSNVFAKICETKLAYLIGKEVEVEYLGEVDSKIKENKVDLISDALLANIPLDEMETSLIIYSEVEQVPPVADLLAGSSGAGDGELSDKQKSIFLDTVEQCVSSSLKYLMTKVSGLKLSCGNMTSHSITANEAYELDLLGEMDAIAFKLKFVIDNGADISLIINIDKSKYEEVLATLSAELPNPDLDDLLEDLKPEVNAAKANGGLELGTEEEGQGQQDTLYNIDEKRNLSFISDVNLDLIVELGRVDMEFSDVLNLTKGSAIELDRQCNQAVDLYVHNQLVAKGEVVAIDDCFGLKVTEVLGSVNLFRDYAAK